MIELPCKISFLVLRIHQIKGEEAERGSEAIEKFGGRERCEDTRDWGWNDGEEQWERVRIDGN